MKIEAFSTPIYVIHNDDNVEIKSIVKEYYKKYRLKSSTPDKWNCQLFTTFGTTNFPTDCLQKLTNTFNQFQIESQKFGNMRFTELWLNCYKKMNWQERHTHSPGQWSGVYYAIFDPKEHSPTLFYHPNENLLASNGIVSQATLYPKVKEGDMVIFPSWLEHAAPVNKSSKLRATISFNFLFDKI
tara:strand:- start:335 stop:889 length:555 start_codon:yes stop_codon:yes gene_type:complete